jgi:hypothetical protein
MIHVQPRSVVSTLCAERGMHVQNDTKETTAEPQGCPTPGACSCPGYQLQTRHQIVVDLEVGDDPEGVLMLIKNLLFPRGIRLISIRVVADD